MLTGIKSIQLGNYLKTKYKLDFLLAELITFLLISMASNTNYWELILTLLLVGGGGGESPSPCGFSDLCQKPFALAP